MTNISRIAFALALLALLIAPLAALQLNVVVTNEIGTRLPGTHVQILVANTTLYEQTAKWCPSIDLSKNCSAVDDRAVASFTLAPGTYFLRLQRSGYPDHVYLQTLNDDTTLPLIMFIKKSTYTVFGRVAVNPESFVGESIKLVDDKSDSILRSTTIKDNGYFILESLWPDTWYHARVDRGTERLISKSFSHSEIGAYYVEVNAASEPLQNITTRPTFSAPMQADLHSKIRVRLLSQDRPMAGQPMTVTTPNGPLNLTTDTDGYVYVWAAEGGDYVFNWQSMTQTVSVPYPEAPAAPVIVAPVVVEPAPAASEPVTAAPVASTDNTAAIGLSVMVVLGLGVVVVVILAAIFGPKLIKRMRSNSASSVPPTHPIEPGKSASAPLSPPAAPAAPSTSHKGASHHPTHPSAHHAHPKHKKR